VDFQLKNRQEDQIRYKDGVTGKFVNFPGVYILNSWGMKNMKLDIKRHVLSPFLILLPTNLFFHFSQKSKHTNFRVKMGSKGGGVKIFNENIHPCEFH